jgi:isopenicillin-N epimerase
MGARGPQPQVDLHRHWADEWTLDPEVTFLNHGSFGACPRAVLDAQAQLRAELERQPLRFLWREYEARLDAARGELAAFLGADRRDLVFVPNATTGLNAVLRSLPLQAGDELIVTDHEYNATRNILDFVARRARAEVVLTTVPFPLHSDEQVITAILERVTERTRLVLLDHVTSLTGLVFPVAVLAAELAAQGIDLVVDGAHAPGMIPLDLGTLGVPLYAGNCHKWLCAPKGAGFLYVQRERQAQICPTVISHGANAVRPDRSRFHLEFDWTGTDDPTAYLCVPEAIRFMGALLPGGWPELMARNRAMALAARALLCETLDLEPPCPEGMIGALATVALPPQSVQAQLAQPQSTHPQPEPDHDELEDLLDVRHRTILPVRYWPRYPHRVLRISAQAYNSLEQYERLAGDLKNRLD